MESILCRNWASTCTLVSMMCIMKTTVDCQYTNPSAVTTIKSGFGFTRHWVLFLFPQVLRCTRDQILFFKVLKCTRLWVVFPHVSSCTRYYVLFFHVSNTRCQCVLDTRLYSLRSQGVLYTGLYSGCMRYWVLFLLVSRRT